MENIYLFSALIILIYMNIWFFVAQAKKDNSIVDVAWGLGFITLSWLNWKIFGYPNNLILPIFVTIYGLRLASHIYFRNKTKKEDWRYAKWREEWGKNTVLKAFLKVFMLQGFFMWIIALPLMQLGEPSHSIFLIQYFGLGVSIFGLIWESVADWQLLNFKRKPENKGLIMTKGLWAYSRHPNYFGEILIWWGIYFFTIPYSSFFTILSPVTITWLLNNISGVPMLESKYKDHPEYQNYIKSTNALIPKLFRS